MTEPSDDSLVVRVAAGDHAAFALLMTRHMRRAISIARGVARNTADADEIAQDAFLRLWTHAGRFDRTRGGFTAWFGRIVLNLTLDRRRRPVTELLDDRIAVADDRPDALDRLIGAERDASLHAGLDQLGDWQRAAIVLFHVEGISGHDCAQILDLSDDAFESLLSRARRSLRRAIDRQTSRKERCTP
nr:sigma-70 family RNA polymerase sigma factor [uncultured Tistrella sp.]